MPAETHLGLVDYAILAIYSIFVLAVGFSLKGKMRTSEDFFLSGRSLPSWMTGLAFIAANLGALEVMRTHGQHDVVRLDQFARELLGPVCTEVEVPLQRHEQRAIRGRRPVPGAGSRARRLHVGETAVDGLAARQRLGQRAATGVTGAHEQQAHDSFKRRR